ncbi:hypothetical protein [Salinibaculum rarum]|uniref:hypothetical protein n=1 Tax=Salinibaculum rarum TaxID=3058903 RepID=UPI00265E99C3|nr:hypothetical protein [Salinibaculum sp. KK48]
MQISLSVSVLLPVVAIVLVAGVVNGILYVSPIWMGKAQFYAVAAILVTTVAWPALELRWRFPDVTVRSPVYRCRGDDTADATESQVDDPGDTES